MQTRGRRAGLFRRPEPSESRSRRVLLRRAAWRLAFVGLPMADRNVRQSAGVRNLQFFEVALPVGVALFAELPQIVPGVDAGVVTVVEDNADGVVANEVYLLNVHVFLAGHQLA